jgi:hypothetical protein
VTTTIFATIFTTVSSTTFLGIPTTIVSTTSTTTVTVVPQTDIGGAATTSGANWVGYAYCSSFVATKSGSVQTLGINLKSGAGNALLALYDYSFNLVGQTSSFSIAGASGWVDAPASGSITGGSQYWLCTQSGTASASVWFSYGSGEYISMTYGPYPSKASPSTDQYVPNLRITYQ